MTLFDLSGAFFILCLGISVSILVFLLELIFKRFKLHYSSSSNNKSGLTYIADLVSAVEVNFVLPLIKLQAAKEKNSPHSESIDAIKVNLKDPTIKMRNVETLVVLPATEVSHIKEQIILLPNLESKTAVEINLIQKQALIKIEIKNISNSNMDKEFDSNSSTTKINQDTNFALPVILPNMVMETTGILPIKGDESNCTGIKKTTIK